LAPVFNGVTLKDGLPFIPEEPARISASIPVALFPHSILCAHNIYRYGNEEQKGRDLPDLAKGRIWGAMALAEEAACSDIFSLRTKAKKSGNWYVLRGSKTYTTNVPFAEVYLVFAKTGKVTDPRISLPLSLKRGLRDFLWERLLTRWA
jgi:isovaleryl-CoA dehydrogenase